MRALLRALLRAMVREIIRVERPGDRLSSAATAEVLISTDWKRDPSILRAMSLSQIRLSSWHTVGQIDQRPRG